MTREKKKKKKKKYSQSSRKLARQGGFHSTTLSALNEDIPAVLLTLSSLPESDSMVYGLLKNIRSGKFIATLYVLNSVLPHLAYLLLAFQKGKVNFGHIEPALQCTKDALKDLKTGQMLQTLRADLPPEGISLNYVILFFIYFLVLFLTHCISNIHITG